MNHIATPPLITGQPQSHAKRVSIRIVVAAKLLASRTLEQIKGRTAVLVERLEQFLPFVIVVDAKTFLDRGDDVRTCRTQLLRAGPAKKPGRIAAVCPPLFLLPARKTRRAIRDFLDHLFGNLIPFPTPANALLIC